MFIKIPKYKKGTRLSLSIPKGFSLNKDFDIFLIKKNEKFPMKKLIYSNNFWIINEGHDYSLNRKSRIFESNSDLFNIDKKLLICYGPEIFNTCSNGHKVEDFQLFCGYCGIKL